MTKPLNRRSLSMPLMGSDDDTTNYYMVGWSSPTLDIVVFAFSCRPGDLSPIHARKMVDAETAKWRLSK